VKQIIVDPVTRIEGHLSVKVVVEDGQVKEAYSSGTLFRGIEMILRGRDPRDAQRITQRICGVCPTAHSIASALNLDSAFGIADCIPDNGRIMRNLMLGANYLQSHILHFYQLAALDYVDVTAVADYQGEDTHLQAVRNFIHRGRLEPFVPRYEGDYRLTPQQNRTAVAYYLEALEARRKAHELLAVFGGKMPHNVAVIPGGVTLPPTTDQITAFLWRVNELREFIDRDYIPSVLMIAEAYPDYFEIGAGCRRLLAYGCFDLEGDRADLLQRRRFLPPGIATETLEPAPVDPGKIAEELRHSRYDDEVSGRHPSQAETRPQVDKAGAYSWIKAPRYDGQVHEVGPLARIMVAYTQGNPRVSTLVDDALGRFGLQPQALFSVMGRHLARALESKLIADAMAGWVLELQPGEPAYVDYTLPEEGTGMGLVGAPRGALGHWIEIREGKIANYQCVVPTTWNLSPRDDRGQPGPAEQSLIGTRVRDPDNPFEVVRIVRAFDPCLACAVH
jgi:hydrogenase large subunit